MTRPFTASAMSESRDDRHVTLGSIPLRGEETTTRSAGGSLDDLYRKHAVTVASWVIRLVGSDVEIEDIVHEIFLVVHKRLHTFRGDSDVKTWLHGITTRVVADRRRARRWRRWFGWRGSRDRDGTDLVEAASAGEPSALELLERDEARRVVYQVLDRLPEDYRTALILGAIEGLSGQEIAAVTGTTLENVWLRLHRARKQFRKHFLVWEAANRSGERK